MAEFTAYDKPVPGTLVRIVDEDVHIRLRQIEYQHDYKIYWPTYKTIGVDRYELGMVLPGHVSLRREFPIEPNFGIVPVLLIKQSTIIACASTDLCSAR